LQNICDTFAEHLRHVCVRTAHLPRVTTADPLQTLRATKDVTFGPIVSVPRFYCHRSIHTTLFIVYRRRHQYHANEYELLLLCYSRYALSAMYGWWHRCSCFVLDRWDSASISASRLLCLSTGHNIFDNDWLAGLPPQIRFLKKSNSSWKLILSFLTSAVTCGQGYKWNGKMCTEGRKCKLVHYERIKVFSYSMIINVDF
jgi:hypothetical protein